MAKRDKVKKVFIKSGKDKIYVEIGYPKKYPAPAVVIAHGLRSYYTGFLSIFAKALRAAGYISIKFHYVGTGYSTGKFEEKTTKAMLQNYGDVLEYLKNLPEIKKLGVVARSNSGALATLHGPDSRVKAYVFLAPPAYYSKTFQTYVDKGKVKGKFFYHKSFKRPHTKGPGRLPISFMPEIKSYDRNLINNIPKMKPVILFQSTKDEACTLEQGHYYYFQKHLPKPNKFVLINGGNHSYKGHKRYVISESVKWFKKYLPV
jgi:alpha/beta superfamily hydrolase